MLLLRSEPSIEGGLRRLRVSLDPETYSRLGARLATKRGQVTMNVSVFLIMFFVIWLLSTFSLGVATGLIAFTIAMVGLVLLTVGTLIPIIDPEQGMKRLPAIAEVLLLPFFVIGLFFRTVSIRLLATMRHPLQGLAQLPRNWRETVAVIDLCHLPELLPRAGTLDRRLTMQGLLATSFSRPSIFVGYKFVLGLLMYLPAVLYRWNLKASIWLWWPLALVLRSAFEGRSGQSKREGIALTTKGFLAQCRPWLVSLTTTYLTMPLFQHLGFLPSDLAEVIRSLMNRVGTLSSLQKFVPPLGSLRYGLSWTCVILTFILHWLSVRFVAIGDAPSSSRRAENRATTLERLRQCTIAAYVLTGWVFGLWLAQQFWSAQFDAFVWNWIKPWL
jgi:hypothetical protein